MIRDINKHITLLLLATVVTSCGVYKSYQRPSDVEVSDSLYGEDVATDDTISIATLSWRELFQDTHLQSLIEEGLAQNSDMRQAALSIDQASIALTTARLSYLPSLSLGATGTTSSYDGSAFKKSYSVDLTAGWEIDLFGKKWNAKERAIVELEQSVSYKMGVQTRLIATIANSYYTLLMLDKQIEITEQSLSNSEKNIKTLKLLKQNGSTYESAIAQAEASKIAVESSLYTLKQQIRSVENSLSVLLARTPSTIERGSLSSQMFPSYVSTGVPVELLRSRADVRIAENNLAAAYYATNEARANLYPSLSLAGTLGWTNSSGSSITNPGALLISAVASLTQPIFNRGVNQAAVKVSKLQQEQAEIDFQQTILEAGAEVNDALTLWQTASKCLELDQAAIEANKRALLSTQLLMKHGTTNYLEVLVAEQSLLQAELTEANDQYDLISGIITLYYSLGGGEY